MTKRRHTSPRKSRKTPREPYAIFLRSKDPKRAKLMLVDLLKANPDGKVLTTDPKQAKIFSGRNGGHKFLARHKSLRRHFRYARVSL